MDFSPIYISEIDFGGIKIVPNKRLKLIPYKGIRNNFLIEYEPWALSISAKDRISLLVEIKKHIYFLWTEFAEELDSNLENHALKVKYRLLEDFSAFKSSDPIAN
jgi:hypothetical protein